MLDKWYAKILVLALCLGFGAADTDEVQQLPGLNYPINFRQYSGYLNASSGKFLHYWFVESQKNPASDPVVLWMNGGPGCSSLDGFLSELGPFHVEADGLTLYDNPYSWNKVANVIFLEAPAGVGFSYSTSKDYSTDDDKVSLDNYLALQHFFIKFPQFKKNDFYVTGESYGGIYIPTLSVRLLNQSSPINFKGFAVGNGYLEANKLMNSLIFFTYYHGLISNELWALLSQTCCNGNASQDTCKFSQPPSTRCSNAVSKVSDLMTGSGLNTYNLYSDCAPSASAKYSRHTVDSRNILRLFPSNNVDRKGSATKVSVTPPPKNKTNKRESLGSKKFGKKWTIKNKVCTLQNESLGLKSSPPCVDVRNVSHWLNQNSVRTALHIPSFVQSWDICSTAVENGYRRLYDTMLPQVQQLINAGKRGLIYNGDVDMMCNFLGDFWFVDSLGLPVLKDYQMWRYNNQIAGFFKQFKYLTYLTIKGSGHMVPQDKPGPALKMISSFLYNKPY